MHSNGVAGIADLANKIRSHCLKMVCRAKASHIGSAFSIADLVAVLYGSVLRLNPGDPGWKERDRFILSKGHACVAVYAALAECGFFDAKELDQYGANHSVFMAHISHKVRGVEFSTGSLGHGLPFGVGKAMAAKRRLQAWRTFVLLSDGEWDEGSNWEACLFASHHKLDKLIAIVDYNKLQSLGSTNDTLSLEPFAGKFRAFGWSVREVDGHDHQAIQEALDAVPWEPGKPSMLIAHTTKGKGVGFMENKVEWHYKTPTEDQLAQALAELNR